MAEQNRVTPLGDLVAIPLRGAWTGNRGCIHAGKDIARFHPENLWIICALQFRGRWNQQWQPHHYTFLYFHDEAVAFAAGHRRAPSAVETVTTPTGPRGRTVWAWSRRRRRK